MQCLGIEGDQEMEMYRYIAGMLEREREGKKTECRRYDSVNHLHVEYIVWNAFSVPCASSVLARDGRFNTACSEI